jgi:hypothetical protein
MKSARLMKKIVNSSFKDKYDISAVKAGLKRFFIGIENKSEPDLGNIVGDFDESTVGYEQIRNFVDMKMSKLEFRKLFKDLTKG